MNDITPEELKERIDKGEKLHLIDVREVYENEEFNIGGLLIPLGSIPSSLTEIENLKNEELIVYCRSGARSGNAKMFLTSLGFTKVRNLMGGMITWKNTFKV
ncbi:MAG: rhodanese-like domain-containing protein [Bacteroidota bacterium]